ncbi:hypothetical protein DSECCO2_635360 [anaerobic digester metagenome]
MKLLQIIHPGWATGSDQRKLLRMFCEDMYKLAGFLHDRQVSPEVCIKHIFKAQFAKGAVHLALHVRPRFQAKLFAQGHTHGWSFLRHQYQIGIVQRCPQIIRIISFIDRRHGTMRAALTAFYTLTAFQFAIKSRPHKGFKTAFTTLQSVYILNLVAHIGAASAIHTIRRIQSDR